MRLSIRLLPAMIAVGALAAAGPWGLAVRTAAAQGAQCLNPRGAVQQTICLDAELSALADEMRQALRVVIRSIPRVRRPQMLRGQRDWSLTRNRCIGTQNPRQCLRLTYEARIDVLGKILAGSFAGQAPRGAPRAMDDILPDRDLAARPGPALPLQPVPEASAGIAPRPPVERQPLPRLEDAPAGTGQDGAGDSPSPVPVPSAGKIKPILDAPAAPADTQVALGTPAGDNTPATGKVADTLSSVVWRAEITSGIRPGTIFVFHPNGVLLTADCVQAYRLGSWNIAGNGEIMMTGRRGQALRGRVIKMGNRFVRMQVKKKSGAILRTLVLRPAADPFDCSPDQR